MEKKKRGGQRGNAGRKYMGWQEAFYRLKEEYIKVSCMLLEMADAEELPGLRDEIYAYFQRMAFHPEIEAQHQKEMYLGNPQKREERR